MTPQRGQRGMALVIALFAIVLILSLLAVMVDIGTVQLRRTTEELRSVQALAAADAGGSWVRALLMQNRGSLPSVAAALVRAHSAYSFWIDPETRADVSVTIQTAGDTANPDHLDINLQENPQIEEAPLQVISSATIVHSGDVVAQRTVTALVRSFAGATPYSEMVGLIDNAGTESAFSPGDPAGQVGLANATELRIFVFKRSGSGKVSANIFKNASWFDGNSGSRGFLP